MCNPTFDQIRNVTKNLVRRPLKAANLKLRPNKCKLFARRVKYPGHVVSDEGVEANEDMVAAIRDWPTPECKRDVQAFLGTCGYYRKFIPRYS